MVSSTRASTRSAPAWGRRGNGGGFDSRADRFHEEIEMPKIIVPEREVLKNCMERLRSAGFTCWRNNVGKWSGVYKGKPWHVSYGLPGQADIFASAPDGRFTACEAKRLGKKPNERQISFMRQVNATRGVAFWVDDPKYLDTILPHVLAGGDVHVNEYGDITLYARRE
jgi:hypothetical protein